MRRVLLPLLLLALVAVCAVLLRPSVQREFLLSQAPDDWNLRVEKVALLPWSLEVRGLEFMLDGVHYRFGKLETRFNPLTLITDTLTLHALTLQHTEIDARGIAADNTEAASFPGVLAILNHGLALRLDALDANASVKLPQDQSLTIRSVGGSLKPHVQGSLPVTLEWSQPSSAGQDTASAGKPLQTRLELAGRLDLSQLRQGRLRSLVFSGRGSLSTPSRPLPERFDLSFKVAPPPGNLANPYHQRTTLVAGKQVPLPNPEAISLETFLVGESGETRAAIAMSGLYRGDEGLLSATWTFNGNETLISPYLVSTSHLPEVTIDVAGALQWSLPTATGRINFAQETAVTLPQATRSWRMRSEAVAEFDAGHLALDTLTLEVGLEGAAQPVLTGGLAQPLRVSLATPSKILEQAQALAWLQLGPFPLSTVADAVPGITLGGELSGRYALRVDDSAGVLLAAEEATRIRDASVAGEEGVWLEKNDLSVQPSLRWTPDALRLDLRDLSLAGTESRALAMRLSVSRGLVEADAPWRLRARGDLALAQLASLPWVREALPAAALPESLSLAFDARLAWTGQRAMMEALNLQARTEAQPEMIVLASRTAFPLTSLLPSGDGQALRLPAGELLHLSIAGLPLAWFNPWLAGDRLDGHVLQAGFTLAADEAGTLTLRPDGVLRVGDFDLRAEEQPRLTGLSLNASPALRREGDRWSLAVSGMQLSAHGHTLAEGDFDLRWEPGAAGAAAYAVRTDAQIDFGQLVQQPLVASSLPPDFPALPLRGSVALALEGQGGAFTVQRGEAELQLGPKAHFSLQASPGLAVRRHLDRHENLARHAVGALTLDVRDLPSSTLSEFLSLGQVRFKEVNARLRLVSDGQSLTVGSELPLRLEAVRLLDDQRALSRPFTLTGDARLEATRRRVNVLLDDLALVFEAGTQPAVAGRVRAGLVPGAKVPLAKLDAALSLDLPQLLAQPAVLPGHRLTQGAATLTATVAEDRTLTANLALIDLDARSALAIRRLELPLTGTLAADGRGFDFSAPVLAASKSGPSRAALQGHYAPQPDEPRVISLNLSGEVFYLNDLLSAWQAIAPVSGRAAAVEVSSARRKGSRAPDLRAAWKLIPPAVVIDVAIDRLFYSDYLAFDAVHGKLDLRSRRFGLQGVGARFHASEIGFDGVMRFKAGTPDPYSLELKGRIRDFDLNTFFTELVPGEKPRVEGLFGVKFDASGDFPNFSQLRNRLLFDVRMKSREGLFRPLPPDSGLMLGASDILGTLGEGLSYLPTGGFGAGAVARLVNYIAEIDYDTIDVHLVRDGSRQVQVEEFQLLSPTIALTATGGIRHLPEEDILDSPLELSAELDMLGRGAAILYSLDLMRDEKNAYGYWRGPSFRIWGTPAAPESNFDEIVNAAGAAAVQGAFKRPLSGLIGNLKFRWFDDDSVARERAREDRRARDSVRAAEEAAREEAVPAP